MLCPFCGRAAPDGSRFCAACGAALTGSGVATIAAVPRASRPRPTDSLDHARFIPGTMLADRYRIVALLGRGGMGEVYRAEDLKLGQPVALEPRGRGLACAPDVGHVRCDRAARAPRVAETLIGWTRLLAGRARDPLVGRDILIGVTGGVVSACLFHLGRLAPTWFGLAPPMPTDSITPGGLSLVLLGGRYALSLLVFILGESLANGVIGLLILLLLTVLLRSRRAAAVGYVAISFAFLAAGGLNARIDLTFIMIIELVLVLCVFVLTLVRFGLLPTVAWLVSFYVLGSTSVRFDASVPYAFSSYLLLGTLVVLTAYGFHTALGGQRIFGASLLKDEPAKQL